MKKTVIALLLLMLLGIAGLLIAQPPAITGGVTHTTPDAYRQAPCIDSDGLAPKLPGFVSAKTWYGRYKLYQEKCDEKSAIALDYTCDGKKIKANLIECSNGCNQENTACEGSRIHVASAPPSDSDAPKGSEQNPYLSLDAALSQAEPGDELIFFDGLTPFESPADAAPVESDDSVRLEIIDLRFKPNFPTAPQTCTLFSLSTLGQKSFTIDYTPSKDEEPLPEEENTIVWGNDDGCFYLFTKTLESDTSQEVKSAIAESATTLARMYDTYCKKDFSPSFSATLCTLPQQEGSEGAPTGMSGGLKLTIKLGPSKTKK